jgi:hypothetical protein
MSGEIGLKSVLSNNILKQSPPDIINFADFIFKLLQSFFNDFINVVKPTFILLIILYILSLKRLVNVAT